jgi:hypothetical protein
MSEIKSKVEQWQKERALAITIGAEIDPKYMQIEPHQCKDSTGKWLKWVPARVTTEV